MPTSHSDIYRSRRAVWQVQPHCFDWSAGGSDAPHLLLGKLDVDVNDPAFWELGLRLLDDMVFEAEELARRF